jgi:hypothetical protein
MLRMMEGLKPALAALMRVLPPMRRIARKRGDPSLLLEMV